MARTHSRSSSRKGPGMHRKGATRRPTQGRRATTGRSGARARSSGTTGVSVSDDENIMRETDRA